ncbi:hypothetical protein [Rhizobium sp. FKY42]|uniref:hypothetical protein n=1 Tax=Rhizobium sp. FKY42 TaxID=2562310 RepID=UPI001485144F|nr:hypothetical protein [Rhizobium sp. FKY42]
MAKKSKPRKKPVTVSMKLNRDGTMTIRSTGGFDLRKLFPGQNLNELSAEHKKGEGA